MGGGGPDVEAVGGADFRGDFYGEAVALYGFFHGAEVNAYFVDGQNQGSGGGSGYDYLIPHIEFATLHKEFGHADIGEVAHPLAAYFLTRVALEPYFDDHSPRRWPR